MGISKGVLSLKSILSADKDMYFWVKLEESKVSEVSIASAF